MRITVLLGGDSTEREVSRVSGCEVARALRSRGHEVLAVDTLTGLLDRTTEEAILEAGVRPPGPLPPPRFGAAGLGLAGHPWLREADLVFPALHGGAGEDGTLQRVLEQSRIPFSGSGGVGCSLAMEKAGAKRLLRASGIPTPDWLLDPGDPDSVFQALGLPVIVKPRSGGSTVGLTLARSLAEVSEGLDRARELGAGVLAERYVEGREFTVGILGDEALPVGEIRPQHELFDYACKYTPGMAEELFPAPIPSDLAERMQALALRAHRALELRDFSRADFIVDGDGTPWCLEVNALPGLTAGSLLPRAAAAAGISFPELCDRIVGGALRRETPEPPGDRTP